MHEPDFLLFASEATWLAVWGGVFLFGSVIAILAERLRLKRRRIDSVGWVPWTGVFFACAFIGAALLLVAMRSWGNP